MKKMILAGIVGMTVLTAGGNWMQPTERALGDNAYGVTPSIELAMEPKDRVFGDSAADNQF